MNGTTLVETIVALAVLATVMAVVGVAVRPIATIGADTTLARLAAAHATAVRTGEPVDLDISGRAFWFLPDGSSSGGVFWVESDAYLVDVLTSEVRRVER